MKIKIMSKPNIAEEMDAFKESIITEYEEALQEYHAQHYMGTDDDMPEHFESWVADLTIMDLEEILDK